MKVRVRQFLMATAFLAQALLTEGKGKNYYSALGLKKNAKEDDIKKAYRCVCCEFYRQSLPALFSVQSLVRTNCCLLVRYVLVRCIFSDHIFPCVSSIPLVFSGRSTIVDAFDREIQASLHEKTAMPGFEPRLRASMPLPEVLILIWHEVESTERSTSPSLLFPHFLQFQDFFPDDVCIVCVLHTDVADWSTCFITLFFNQPIFI